MRVSVPLSLLIGCIRAQPYIPFSSKLTTQCEPKNCVKTFKKYNLQSGEFEILFIQENDHFTLKNGIALKIK